VIIVIFCAFFKGACGCIQKENSSPEYICFLTLVFQFLLTFNFPLVFVIRLFYYPLRSCPFCGILLLLLPLLLRLSSLEIFGLTFEKEENLQIFEEKAMQSHLIRCLLFYFFFPFRQEVILRESKRFHFPFSIFLLVSVY
jgi:hypothetical protein